MRVRSAEPIEGYGVAYRLRRTEYRSPRIEALIEFLNSDAFKMTLLEKFDLAEAMETTSIITAIQKYLTGYEISPHCDIRSKCLTYLININRYDSVEALDVHTHLLKLKPEREYCYEHWEHESRIDRAWVPWDWCETVKEVRTNNTIVIFAPANDTLHAVKLDYPHCQFQRTHIYGNLMRTDFPRVKPGTWKKLRKVGLDPNFRGDYEKERERRREARREERTTSNNDGNRERASRQRRYQSTGQLDYAARCREVAMAQIASDSDGGGTAPVSRGDNGLAAQRPRGQFLGGPLSRRRERKV